MQILRPQNSTTTASSNAQKGKAKVIQVNSPMAGPVNGSRRNGDSPLPQLPTQDERFQRVIRLPSERIDTYEIKRQLNDCLGEDASIYWNAFKRLIYCKIRRQDFEQIVRPLLNEHFELHNMMLFAILNNCIYEDPPPPPDQPVNKKKRGRDGDDEQQMRKNDAARDPKKRKMKELIMSLPREDRERIKANKGSSRVENTQSDHLYLSLPPPGPERLPMYSFEEQQFISQPDPERVPTCHEMKALPDHNTLFEMISQIANSHGITNVSKECADLLNYGLESHLKNIIGNCLQKSRSGGSLNGSLGIRNGEQRYSRASSNQQKKTITARDLAFSFEIL
ncbi:6616_t:CDS:2 [Acaulospora colombiana]|uniref:6616_t:CDS:1 n=1 Tax=Acaulospora colombiana TaxID=27376 RepID=A0ACA9KSP7_9GLOM|nr:6616_t:CDS:2 [Acaulospora colombiana]